MSELKDDLAALRIERAPIRPSRTGRWVGWLLFLLLLAGGAAGGWYWFRRPRPVEVQIATVTERNAGTQAQILNGNGPKQFHPFELFLACAVWFLMLTTIWGFIQGIIERRLEKGTPGAQERGPSWTARLVGMRSADQSTGGVR